MRSMPVVAVKPARQLSGAVFRGFVGSCVGPFAQAGLNEALGLSVGFGRVGFGPQVLDLEPAQGLGVAAGAEGCARFRPVEVDPVAVMTPSTLTPRLRKKRRALKRKRRQEPRVSSGRISE